LGKHQWHLEKVECARHGHILSGFVCWDRNLIGREGDVLKIALTTLNTGRLALPELNVGCAKWSLKIAREWSAERVQWGKPVGQHAAVASKIAFIAATTFGLEAVLDLSGQMSDEGRNDIRIGAALAKLWASEIRYLVADELVPPRPSSGLGFCVACGPASRACGRIQPVPQGGT
jgi:alkylation response protein AidB-like acyl-CoA dehydrogenase